MTWDVEYTDEFGDWWDGLADEEQAAVAVRVAQLQSEGPNLKRPAVGAIRGSAHDPRMKELRGAVKGDQLRVLFIFDPRSTAILLLGGNKTGQWKRWYASAIPAADALYDTYLIDLKKEGLI